MNDLALFARMVDALRPWRENLVLVGGWAHRLHRLHPLADPPAFEPVLTRDADLALTPTDPIHGDIAAALSAAGFRQELSGDHRPPVSRFWFGERGGFHAEFLAPLRGSGVKRSGEPDATVAKAGVTAQKLRYVDLLMVDPFVVAVTKASGFPVERRAEIRVANPVSFIAQKLLIHRQRHPAKRPQDVLYLHDTLEMFVAHLDELREIWRDAVRPSLPDRTAAEAERLAREQFRATNDVIRSAALIPQDRTLAPERVRALCEYGLAEIFG